MDTDSAESAQAATRSQHTFRAENPLLDDGRSVHGIENNSGEEENVKGAFRTELAADDPPFSTTEKHESKDAPLLLNDCWERKHFLPWDATGDWRKLHESIKDLFSPWRELPEGRADWQFLTELEAGHYDLLNEDKFLVTRSNLNTTLKPGSKITMRRWPFPLDSRTKKKKKATALTAWGLDKNLPLIASTPPLPLSDAKAEHDVRDQEKSTAILGTGLANDSSPFLGGRVIPDELIQWEVLTGEWRRKWSQEIQEAPSWQRDCWESEWSLRHLPKEERILAQDKIRATLDLSPRLSGTILAFIGARINGLRNQLVFDQFEAPDDGVKNFKRVRRSLEYLINVLRIFERNSRAPPPSGPKVQVLGNNQLLLKDVIHSLVHQDVIREPIKSTREAAEAQCQLFYNVLQNFDFWSSNTWTRMPSTKATESIHNARLGVKPRRVFSDVVSVRSWDSAASETFPPKNAKLLSFRTDDLDIASLVDFGKLTIEWTDCAAKHLQLELGGTLNDEASIGHGDGFEPVLYLFWYDLEPISWLGTYFGLENEPEALEFAHEIRRSWSFLFHPADKSRRKRVRKAYESLPVPEWLLDYFEAPLAQRTHLEATMGALLTQGIHDTCHDVSQHLHKGLSEYHLEMKVGYKYSLFPHFAGRIRDLRQFMDTRQPKGLRGLWRDSRDSLTFYTFWGVIIFGLASILLGVLSLIASIVQAWASVRSLGPGR